MTFTKEAFWRSFVKVIQYGRNDICKNQEYTSNPVFVCFRVLEASLAENKSGLKRKRGDPWVRFVDPVNPYERQRQDGCPVGLKNVGNTCWFSAVIQVRCIFIFYVTYS